MVQWQLCSLDHLQASGFGRPFPRHGLQLLFWFSNHCVTFELINSVTIMKLVSDCEPENGDFGFHLFGNIEEILPVLKRRNKKKRQVLYFVVGNLNSESYPSSSDLPSYVRENFGCHGDDNVDRLIISLQVRTRVVESLYVTQHDAAAYGRFRHDRTFDVSADLVAALQNPDLDLTALLSWTGYYGNVQMLHSTASWDYQPEYRVQTYRGTTTTQHNNTHKYKYYKYNYNYDWDTPSYWDIYRGEASNKKRSGGGPGSWSWFLRLLFGAAAFYLTVKCVDWFLGDCGDEDAVVQRTGRTGWTLPWRTPGLHRPHVMLDYVY